MNYIIYSISYSKKFGFYRSYIHGMVNGFGDDFLAPIYMRDQDGYFVLDISICNDKHSVLIYMRILKIIAESVMIKS